eukprot:1195368-Prorocentrum_minimum.AAC.5
MMYPRKPAWSSDSCSLLLLVTCATATSRTRASCFAAASLAAYSHLSSSTRSSWRASISASAARRLRHRAHTGKCCAPNHTTNLTKRATALQDPL